MTNAYSKLIGKVGAIQTLIENFPMSVFDTRGKTYTSVIDFILDILRQVGFDEVRLSDEIINYFFNAPNAVETYYSELTNKYIYKELKKPSEYQERAAAVYDTIPDANNENSENYIVVNGTYYYKTTKITHDPQSTFVTYLETSVKTIILEIMTNILSCSVIPTIPEWRFDYRNNEYFPIEIPVNLIDIGNLLDICPTTDIGKNFYLVDDDMTPNTLYKTKDLNAFLWYCLNRGSDFNQTEKNKMMWDSRLIEETDYDYVRNTPEKWNYWLNSDGEFEVEGITEHIDSKSPLHPMIQFYKVGNSPERTIKFLISSQSFEGDTLYNFNKDYLSNIKIFSPRSIITSMINGLLSNNIRNLLNIDYSIEEKIFDAQINEIIKKVIEEDDLTITDCFFDFSNEQYDALLHEMENERYSAKTLNSETEPSIEIDKTLGLDMLNQINDTATINEKIETIKKTVYDISAIPAKDAAIEISDKLSINFNNEWLSQVLMSIIRPVVKSILSPKVMLIFMINFDLIGLINLKDIKNFNDILKIFYRKILSMILSIVQYIKMQIIYFLLNLFEENIKPMIIKYYTYILANEKLLYWIALLDEARRCLPQFNFSSTKVLTQIDDVNYADITQEGDIPESAQEC